MFNNFIHSFTQSPFFPFNYQLNILKNSLSSITIWRTITSIFHFLQTCLCMLYKQATIFYQQSNIQYYFIEVQQIQIQLQIYFQMSSEVIDPKNPIKLAGGIPIDITGDSRIVTFITDGVLRAVYELLLDLAYGLFIAAAALTAIYDANFSSEFSSYIQQPSKRGYVVTLVVLGTMILAAFKIHTDLDSKNISAITRKILNLIEDILRGLVYIIILVLVTPFVFNHTDITVMVASYFIYIISGVLFLTIKLMKWVYFLCGGGKDNNTPWENSTIQQQKKNSKMNPQPAEDANNKDKQSNSQPVKNDDKKESDKKLPPIQQQKMPDSQRILNLEHTIHNIQQQVGQVLNIILTNNQLSPRQK